MINLKKIVLLAVLLTGSATCPAQAPEPLLKPLPDAVRSPLPAPQLQVDSWLLADFESGWIIDGANADARIEPASLTKLMTGYLVFEALANGSLGMQDQVYVSEKAWRTGGSKMFIGVDTRVDVEALLRGLIVQSGNDAAVALAEHLGGSEEGFAALMNRAAAQLGMHNSHFVNASGLPHPEQYSSALDMTILTLETIRRFPDYYRIYAEKEYTYNDITQKNRNVLLWRDIGVDGIKTGYTRKAGYCLIGTAQRDGMRLIATVIGSRSPKARADEVQALLQYGYAAYDSMVVYRAGETVESLPLWMGQQTDAQVGVNRDLGVLFPKGGREKLSGELDLPPDLEAPLPAGREVGRIAIKFDGAAIRTASLHANRDYPQGAWWSRTIDWFQRLFYRVTR